MTGSFGAGFFTLTLLAVLAGLAALLGVSVLAAIALGDRSDGVPAWVSTPAAGLLVAVVGVAGFGVLVLFDEAPFGAGLLVGLVLVPLAAAVGRGWRARRRWLDVISGAAMAWSLPYLLGLAVFLAINVGVIEAFQLAGGEVRALGLHWIGAAGGAVVALAGTVWLTGRVGRWLTRTDR